MLLSRNYIWLFFGLATFFLISGCGDLEPEMQDTRSVVLKMNFKQSYSSRSSQITQADVSNHKTHLIVALPAWEQISSNYMNYYNSFFAADLMNPSENQVNLEIPLNTQMKIFAFIFSGEYTPDQLISGVSGVSYYGESPSFSIGTNTNNLSLGVTLQSAGSADGNSNEEDTAGTVDQGGTNSTTPFIDQITAVASNTSDSTPDYTFASTAAGTITYGGSCSSSTSSANPGNNTITFNTLSNGTYSDCTIKITTADGNDSNILTIPAFTVQATLVQTFVLFETTTPTRSGNNIVYSLNNSSLHSDSDLQADGVKIGYRMELNYNGTDYYAEVFFNAWDNITQTSLQFPTVLNGNVIQLTVDNMSVSSNYPTVTNTSSTIGRLEIWPFNYSAAANGGIGGSSSKYDFDDTHTGNSSYGSMQVHDLSAAKTVMAWNKHGDSNPDIGIGNNPNSLGHSDWTFSGASSLGKLNWKFQVLIRR
ncbi:hypothetical protein OAJ61_01195 [bacterium]|nr:hypothetical protein [bacterium]